MNIISKEQCINLIIKQFPGFEEMWAEHIDWWGGENPGLSNNMAVFSRYTIKLLQDDEKNQTELKNIFLLIEKFIVDGSDEVKDAAATCFLENVMNATSWKKIPSSSFIHLLGRESKSFCKAWDKFTGIKTEGLWLNDEDKNL